MTRDELLAALSRPFYDDFAATTARRVRDADAVGLLYAVATAPHETLPKFVRHQALFRSAYVLEKIYFDAPESFNPYLDDFCRRAFSACTDPSARRHFAKIMADLLTRHIPEQTVLELIAQTAAAWAVAPESKAAVRVWSVEVLQLCRGRLDWLEPVWRDLLEFLSHDATPGIASRLRRKWTIDN